jgi:parvulin-like peptidyl-prolyl isomerase
MIVRYAVLALLALPFAAELTACSGTTTPPAGDVAPGTDPGTTPAVGDAAPATDHGAVLAEVGDVKVYADEFQAAAARKTPADGKALSMDEKKEVLQKLIEEKALYLEARKKGVDQDPKVQKVMVNALLRQEVYAGVRNSDFTQEELQAYFDAHKEEFVVPEKVQVKRIFIRVSDERPDDKAKALAEDLRRQVVANPSKFGEIATNNSEDPYRRRGGDLGFVGRDGKPGIDQAVVDRAFGMKVDEVSEVFKAGDGYNIVVVASKRDRVERTFDQMRGSVLRKVKNDKYKALYDKYVADVSQQYPATVHEDALASITIDAAQRMSLGAPGVPGIRGPGDLGEEPGEGLELPGPGAGDE